MHLCPPGCTWCPADLRPQRPHLRHVLQEGRQLSVRAGREVEVLGAGGGLGLEGHEVVGAASLLRHVVRACRLGGPQRRALPEGRWRRRGSHASCWQRQGLNAAPHCQHRVVSRPQLLRSASAACQPHVLLGPGASSPRYTCGARVGRRGGGVEAPGRQGSALPRPVHLGNPQACQASPASCPTRCAPQSAACACRQVQGPRAGHARQAGMCSGAPEGGCSRCCKDRLVGGLSCAALACLGLLPVTKCLGAKSANSRLPRPPAQGSTSHLPKKVDKSPLDARIPLTCAASLPSDHFSQIGGGPRHPAACRRRRQLLRPPCAAAVRL